MAKTSDIDKLPSCIPRVLLQSNSFITNNLFMFDSFENLYLEINIMILRQLAAEKSAS